MATAIVSRRSVFALLPVSLPEASGFPQANAGVNLLTPTRRGLSSLLMKRLFSSADCQPFGYHPKRQDMPTGTITCSATQPMKSFTTFTLAPALFAALMLLTSGCDSGLTSKASPGNAQALKSLELKTGLSFPTNALLVASGDGGGRDASHQFYEWAVFSPTPVTLPKMVAPGVQDYLKLPLKDTAEFVQSRMEVHRIVEPQAAFSTDWKTNGLAFTATLVRGIRGDYLVITQGKL